MAASTSSKILDSEHVPVKVSMRFADITAAASFTGGSSYSSDTIDMASSVHEEGDDIPEDCPQAIPDPSSDNLLIFHPSKLAYFSADGLEFAVKKVSVDNVSAARLLYVPGSNMLAASTDGDDNTFVHGWRGGKLQLVEGALVNPETGEVEHEWCVDVRAAIREDLEEYESAVLAVSREGAVAVMDSLNELGEFVLERFREKQAAVSPAKETWLVPSLGADLQTWGNGIMDAVVAAKPADYHPGSENIVNDVLHPSLYPYIWEQPSTQGKFTTNTEYEFVSEETAEHCDVWGRPYEGSIYQWLPSDWVVSDDGKVSLAAGSHLNAPRVCTPLLPLLEAVYTAAVPLLDALVEYVESRTAYQQGPRPTNVSVKGRTLQIVPKIVEFELQPGQTYSGVWHYEAMSHENIIGTVLYVLRRDEGLQGGQLAFKRAFFDSEAEEVMYDIFQNPPQAVFHHMEELVPLGQTELPEGTLLVFPNCHAHRVMPLTNTTDALLRRRIVVGFVVNPEVTIPSAATVANLSESVALPDALAHREALMAERRLHKQSMNQREVNLCEH